MRTCLKTNTKYLSGYCYWNSTCGVWNTELRKIAKQIDFQTLYMNNETLSMIFYTNLKDSNNVSRDLNQVVENICSIFWQGHTTVLLQETFQKHLEHRCNNLKLGFVEIVKDKLYHFHKVIQRYGFLKNLEHRHAVKQSSKDYKSEMNKCYKINVTEDRRGKCDMICYHH